MTKRISDLENIVEGSIRRNHLLDTLANGERLVEITKPYSALLTMAYHAFMDEIFAKSEVDPLSSMREEVKDKRDLGKITEDSGINPIFYTTLVASEILASSFALLSSMSEPIC